MDCDNKTAVRRGLGGEDGMERRGEKGKLSLWRGQHQEKNSWSRCGRVKMSGSMVLGSTHLKLDFEMLLFIRMSTTALPREKQALALASSRHSPLWKPLAARHAVFLSCLRH